MQEGKRSQWRDRLFTTIFEAETTAGKIFDVCLLLLILMSIGVVMLQSVGSFNQKHAKILVDLEWIITIIFTVEYLLRLIAVRKPIKYATSFYGIVDLLSILPSYLSLILPQSRFLLVIRALRLMRVFRVFELSHFVQEGMQIVLALKASAKRILVFLSFMTLVSVVMGALIYVVESPYNDKFSSIPQSIYWSIVTITTVGYGDISPVTSVGKILASFVMLLGYAIIAIPTGIVSVEMSKSFKNEESVSRACANCGESAHAPDAKYCKFCGEKL